MVWARTKIMMHDDLLRPWPRLTLNYSGPTPERLYKEVPDLLCSIFRIPQAHLHEKKFSWSKGEPEKFKVAWEAEKPLDKWSYLWLEISLEGKASKGSGDATVVLEGALRTEYPQDTLWEKSLLYEIMRVFWHRTFYTATRTRYHDEGRRLMSEFISHLKTLIRGGSFSSSE
jgi:hypothetical protein